MATSHYCNGKWRSGPVSACPRHDKLAKKQTNVYRGVGEPGGRSSSKPQADSPSKGESKASPSDSSPKGGSKGSSSSASSD